MESSTRPSEEWRELTEFASEIAILAVDLSGGNVRRSKTKPREEYADICSAALIVYMRGSSDVIGDK
jgi:hypothetical protein